LALSYPSGLDAYPDRVTPDASSTTVFTMSETSDPVAIRYPASGSATYRLVFFGAPLEAFTTGGADPNNIETVIERSLTWFAGDVTAPTAPTNPALAPDGTLTWSPATDNVGVDHYCIYRNTLFYFEVQGMTPVTTTTSTSVQMTEGIGDPLVDYIYRITAQDGAGNQSTASPAVGEREYAAP
jgi:hypothetical protein